MKNITMKFIDKSLTFYNLFEQGQNVAKKTLCDKLDNDEKYKLFINENGDNIIDCNHSFFQGFMQECIEQKINVENLFISDSESNFSIESFNFAKDTWRDRVGK